MKNFKQINCIKKIMGLTALILLQAPIFATQAFLAVSLSMPSDSLKQYIMDAHRLNIPIVIRGMYTNPSNKASDDQSLIGNMNDTQARIKSLMGDKKEGGIEIDPMLFRSFNIQVVPSFVVFDDSACEASNGKLCDANSFDLVKGNIPIQTQLTIVAKKSKSQSRSDFCNQKLLNLSHVNGDTNHV